MKPYPKIQGISFDTPWDQECIVFDKLDESNLKFSYSPKKGWYQFGTRHRLFDRNDKDFGQAIDIFLNKYGESLSKIMSEKFPKMDAIAYCEFLGPVSFAGLHDSNKLLEIGHLKELISNDPKDLILFDFNVHKKGFLSPVEFLKCFSHLDIPRVVYQGKLTKEFVERVRLGDCPGFEGVIVKGGEGHKLWSRKIKTNAYLDHIKKIFGTGWTEYDEN